VKSEKLKVIRRGGENSQWRSRVGMKTEKKSNQLILPKKSTKLIL
jgi:hypothetical protein